ncbi:sortase B [Lachnospiraceae bacterium PM6-15]
MKEAIKKVRKRITPGLCFRLLLSILLIVIACVSLLRLARGNQEYTKEKEVHKKMLEYRPISQEEDKGAENQVNPQIQELKKINPDVAGWVYLNGTSIDYPFVAAGDYSEYLRTDIYGDYSLGGTVFTDYRLGADFTGFQTILFGHSMDNGSMFMDLLNFRDREYFKAHREGVIYLEKETLELELIACVVVDATQEEIYGVKDTVERKTQFLKSLRERDVHGAEETPKDLAIQDRFVLLSTCSYEHNEARTVVVYRIKTE